ncbi:MAG: hypothetical protein ACJA2W_003217 [Planctomycetota bacterium]|jgi:hypothetical protein
MALGAIAMDVAGAREARAKATQANLAALPHFAPKAKRVIFLTQSGGPSQLELFDPKPRLQDLAGTPLPESVRGGQRVTGMTAGKPQLVMPGRAKFRPRGECGMELSDWIPHLAGIADDLCLVRSMTTDEINHAPAMTKFLTGHQIPGRPSLGSWISYGLGSMNRDLPDYVALLSKLKRGSDQPLYDHYWGSGFLPSIHQGVKLRAAAEPVLYLQDPEGMTRELRRRQLDGLGELNRRRQAVTHDPETLTRIEQYEMAFRMQASVPELTDLSGEPDRTFELYGPDSRRAGTYASNCILARRMIERGVRFVQLFHPDWDHHSRLTSWCTQRCRDTDQPSAALITDLKERGLLDDTLVVWGGEFGRSVAGQGDWQSVEAGRDHHPRCFSVLLAGAGIRPGTVYGGTDDFSFNVTENPVHVRDLHATILHLLGIEHERFTFRSQGLDMRLTGVEKARIVSEILA